MLTQQAVGSQARVFEYRPKLWMVLSGILFFGFGAFWSFQKAFHNDRGLIFEGIPLSVGAASVFWWVLFALFAGMTAAAIVVSPQAFVPRWIMLEEEAITLPRRGFGREHDRILPGEIQNVTSTVVRNRIFLKVHANGRVYPINPSWLPGSSDLQTIIAWLNARRQYALASCLGSRSPGNAVCIADTGVRGFAYT